MGKKNKGSSKNYSKNSGGNGKNSKQAKQQNGVQCAVCRFQIERFSRAILTCLQCKKKVHKGCYSPDEKRPNIFVCDMCAQKKKKVHCLICRQFGELQMLKQIEGGFVHVQCAIMSPQIKVQSFSKLNFSFIEDEKKQDSKKKAKNICSSCGTTKDQNGNGGLFINCYVCKRVGHFRCWMVQLEDYGYAMMTKFLEVCETQNFLLSYLFHSKKVQTSLKGIVHVAKKANYTHLAICEKHEKDFTWCPACKDKKKNDEQFFQCEDCGRYYHQSCAGVKMSEKFYCDGCKNKNPFMREYKIFDLLSQMSKIEKNTKLTYQNIRVLNSFGYRYSTALQRKIQENLQEIEEFFALNEIAKIMENKDEFNTEEKKKIRNLIFYALEDKQKGEMRPATNDEIKEFTEQMQKNRKTHSFKGIAEKINKVFEKDFSEAEKFKDFGAELLNFTMYFKDKSIRKSVKDMTDKLKSLSDKFTQIFLNTDEINKNFLKAFNSKMKGKFLGAILGKNLSQTELQRIVKLYMSIKMWIQSKRQITEDQSKKMKEQILEIKNTIQRSQQIVDFLNSSMKEIKVKYYGLLKEDLYLSMEKRFKDGFNNLEEIQNFQKNSIEKDYCTIRGHKIFETLNVSIIEYNVMKKKFMSFCKEGDCGITQNHFQLIPKLKHFLITRNKYLTAEQKSALESYLTKLYFMSFLLKKSQPILSENKKTEKINMSIEGAEEGIEGEALEEQIDEQQTIFTRIYGAMENWDDRMASLEEVINNLSMLAVMKVKFEERLTFEKIATFAKNIIGRVDLHIQSNKIKGQLLQSISKIITYFGLEDEYEYYCEQCDEYEKYVKITCQGENDIAKILQKNDSLQTLLKTLQQKMTNIPYIHSHVDFTTQIKKMSLLKQWCLLSQKMLSSKRKPTINAVQNIKTLFERTMYPQNEVYSKVCRLDNESKALNKQIMRYLDKAKVQEFMEIFDELKMVSKKMNYAEGVQMKKDFQTSNLDITAEIQQLESELKDFENLPQNLQPIIQKGNLNEMKQLRKKILDCSFKIQNISDYDRLIRKIYQIRCIMFQPPVTRKQYFQLLSLGGAESLVLAENTANLHRAYKLLEKAEQQLLMNNIRRRNFANLIPYEEKKVKQLKEDLKFDQIQLNNLERAKVHTQKLREQFNRLKAERAYIQRYVQLEDQMAMTLFSNKEIVNQIANMRRDVMEFYKKVESTMFYHNQQQNVYMNQPENILRSERMMLEKYMKFGIRYAPLDMFERDCKTYRDIEIFSNPFNPRKYRIISVNYCKLSDRAAKIPQIQNTRGKLYFSVLEHFHESELDMQIYHGLINQGLQLKRLEHPRAREIFESLFDVYGRVKERIEEDDEESDKNPDGMRENQNEDSFDEVNEEDEDDMDEDGDIEDMMDEESSYQSDESDEQDGNDKKNDGAPIVLDDSD